MERIKNGKKNYDKLTGNNLPKCRHLTETKSSYLISGFGKTKTNMTSAMQISSRIAERKGSHGRKQ
jgi:hypothetical protein